jgi:FkbM family methyltransferase
MNVPCPLPFVGRIFAISRHFWPNDRFLWPIAQIINRVTHISRQQLEYITALGFCMGLDPYMFPDGAMLYGTFEVATQRLLRRLARPGHVAADVGANIGYHTLTLSQLVGLTGKVYAFEPHPQTLARLKLNLAANDCRNVQIYSIALSDRKSEAELFVGQSHGQASLRFHGRQACSMACVTERLDVIFADLPRLDIIKIDVEGAEHLVLQGALETLRRLRPHVILERNDEALAAFDTDFPTVERLLAPSHYGRLIETNRGFANYHFVPLKGVSTEPR